MRWQTRSYRAKNSPAFSRTLNALYPFLHLYPGYIRAKLNVILHGENAVSIYKNTLEHDAV
jgi:hypothetical protein